MLSIVGALPLAVIAVCGTPSAEIARPAGAAPGVYRSRPPSEGGERFAALAGPADLGSTTLLLRPGIPRVAGSGLYSRPRPRRPSRSSFSRSARVTKPCINTPVFTQCSLSRCCSSFGILVAS